MGTDVRMIVKAQQEVKPRDVTYNLGLPEAGSLVVLDNGSLRRQVEWFSCQRHLTWEEWQDVRDAWCRWNRVVVCSCIRGDTNNIKRMAEQGMREGYQYLLLEYV